MKAPAPSLDQELRHRHHLSVREQQAIIRANVDKFLARINPKSADWVAILHCSRARTGGSRYRA